MDFSTNTSQLIGSVFRKQNYKKRAQKEITWKVNACGFKTILAGYFLGLYTVVKKLKEFWETLLA